ncbi:MAG TPA: hypothetical protein VLC95_17045 [Anaerolineae bacterium]|nr:hypothetical protein [Anaerolineae bacterium]
MQEPRAGARGVDDGSSYTVGIMRVPVEKKPQGELTEVVERAVDTIRDTLTRDLGLEINLFEFEGPHILPSEGGYSPFDFLELGLAEKIERGIHFLLIVSEVGLSTSNLSYVLAFPSQLTNVGIVSIKRLSPSFWGHEADTEVTASRLAALMLHTFGHIVNLSHNDDQTNVMADIGQVTDLDRMHTFTGEQLRQIRENMPREARDAVQDGRRLSFIVRHLVEDWRAILVATVRANPLRLITRLPTMLAAAGSAIVVLFFSAEVWDVASSMGWLQLALFAVFAVLVATFVLYSAFSFGPLINRRRRISESTVVTVAVTQVTLLITIVLFFFLFVLLAYIGAITIFPNSLMSAWVTADPVSTQGHQLQASVFVASTGVLAGSLGGRADSRRIVRGILFLNEET